MARIDVEPAAPGDRDRLETLIADCYSAVYPGWYEADLLTDALPEMLRIDQRLLESGRYFAAMVDGQLAGCGGWSLFAPGAGKGGEATGHIRHFATHPQFMRMGVGGAILERCVRDAGAAGVRQLQCFSSKPGEAFYARHGFERVGEVAIMLGDSIPFPAILMKRDLR